MSKIEAVNRMLSAIQMRPVQSLEEPLDPTVAQAKLTIDQELLSLLKKGWEFNIEDGRTLPQDTSTGYVAVPTEVIAIDFTGLSRGQGRFRGALLDQASADTGTYRLTVRSQKIYNSTQRTFVIGQDITANLMVAIDYADCPPAIQEAAKKWSMPIRNWKAALNRFMIEFPERMPETL